MRPNSIADTPRSAHDRAVAISHASSGASASSPPAPGLSPDVDGRLLVHPLRYPCCGRRAARTGLWRLGAVLACASLASGTFSGKVVAAAVETVLISEFMAASSS